MKLSEIFKGEEKDLSGGRWTRRNDGRIISSDPTLKTTFAVADIEKERERLRANRQMARDAEAERQNNASIVDAEAQEDLAWQKRVARDEEIRNWNKNNPIMSFFKKPPPGVGSLKENLTKQEREQLQGYSPEFVQTISNVASSLRKGGKKIDLMTMVKQLPQVGYKSPEIDKFLSTPLQSSEAPTKNVVPQPGITPPPAWLQQNAKQQFQQAAPRVTPAPAQARRPNVAPPPSFVGAPAGANVFGHSSVFNPEEMQTIQDESIPQQQLMSPTQRRVQLSQQIGKKNTMRKESKQNLQEFNMGQVPENIRSLVARMSPAELIAMASYISSQMGQNKTSGGGRSSSSSSSSMSVGFGENMKTKYSAVLKENIVEQIKVRNLTEHYLNEGPMASVWQGIKQAGTSAVDRLTGKSVTKDAQNVGVGENTKKLGQELTKMIGKVNQMRHKFNSSILKNAEAVSQYHDLVQNLWQAYNQNLQVLGPFASQLQRQVQDAVGNFHYDLTSEKEQIDSFLNSLKDVKPGNRAATGTSETLGRQARATAQEKRSAEADASQRMTGTSTKANPGGGHRALAALQANTAGSKEEIKKRISMASTPAERQAAVRDLEKLFIKTSKRNVKEKDD